MMDSQVSIETYENLERPANDLIGRRILCVLKNCGPAGPLGLLPSPVQVSSEFWSPEALKLAKQSNENDLNELAWCPKHHHHQDRQKAVIDRLRLRHQEATKKLAVVPISKTSNQSAVANKRARQKQQRQQTGPLQATLSVTEIASSPKPTAPIELQLCDSKVQKGTSDEAHYCELCDKATPTDIGDENNDACDDYDSKLRLLRNLPWRLGIIRAVCDGKNAECDLADLLVEFDLLDWKAREWFHVSRNRLSAIRDDLGENRPKIISDESFTELLIEDAVGCCKRQHSPAGKDKLWPARIFRVLLDELELFKSDQKKVTAIEYFDPVALSDEPQHCLDGKTIEAELVANLPESVFTNCKLAKQKQAVACQNKSTTGDTSNDCDRCQSPIVEFVAALDILKPTIDQDSVLRKTSFRRFLEFIGCLTDSPANNIKSPSHDHAGEQEEPAKNLVSDFLRTLVSYPRIYSSLRDWHLFQDAQSLLASATMAPSLVGNRVRVYKFSSATQWYTAVIMGYEPKSGRLRLIDDTVLEQHYEEPSQIEMHLIDAEIVQSIIEGTSNSGRSSQVGTSRRRVPRAASQQQQAQAGATGPAKSSRSGLQQASKAAAAASSAAALASSQNNSPSQIAGASTSSSSSSLSSSLVPMGSELAVQAKRSLAAAGYLDQQLARSDSVGFKQTLLLGSDGLSSKTAAKSDFGASRGSKVSRQTGSTGAGGGGVAGSRSSKCKSPAQIGLPFGDLFAWSCLDTSQGDSDRSLELQGATLDGRNFISHRLRLQDLCQQISSSSEPSCSSSSQMIDCNPLAAFDRLTTPDESPPTSSSTSLSDRRQPTFEFASLRAESIKRKQPETDIEPAPIDAKVSPLERQQQVLVQCQSAGHLGELDCKFAPDVNESEFS